MFERAPAHPFCIFLKNSMSKALVFFEWTELLLLLNEFFSLCTIDNCNDQIVLYTISTPFWLN